MSVMSLIPADPITERLLVEVIVAMIKNELAKNQAAAASEFPRPDAATTKMQPVQTDIQSDSTTDPVSGQNELELVENVGLPTAMS